MPNYPGQSLLDAIQKKREIEAGRPTIAGSFGAGAGAGMVKGVDTYNTNTLTKLADERKFNTEFITSLFEKNMPVTVKNPSAQNVFDRYEPVPMARYPQMADVMRKAVAEGADIESALPGISFIPRESFKNPAAEKPVQEYEKKSAPILDGNGKVIGYTPAQEVKRGAYVPPVKSGETRTGTAGNDYKNLYNTLKSGISEARNKVNLYGKSGSDKSPNTMFDEDKASMYEQQGTNLQETLDYLIANPDDVQGARDMIQSFGLKEVQVPGEQKGKGFFEFLQKDIPASTKKEVTVSKPGAQGNIRQQAIDALKSNGYPTTEANISAIMKQLGK